jgi:hypothetical protein
MSIFDNIQKKNRMRYDTTLFRILSNYIFQQDIFTLSFFESIISIIYAFRQSKISNSCRRIVGNTWHL